MNPDIRQPQFLEDPRPEVPGRFPADRPGADPVLHGQRPELHPDLHHPGRLPPGGPAAGGALRLPGRRRRPQEDAGFRGVFLPAGTGRLRRRAELRGLRPGRGHPGRQRQHALGLRFGPDLRQPAPAGAPGRIQALRGQVRAVQPHRHRRFLGRRRPAGHGLPAPALPGQRRQRPVHAAAGPVPGGARAGEAPLARTRCSTSCASAAIACSSPISGR